ncbi:MAG: IS3 family transposase [Acidovorax sp.]|uniref:IS3 family transposase n=1 Tax=Acidovorax sp. TaxID=1872122 RepID=UPI0022C6438C|nr:IS3 family transposase [Acidovorax sp.]MCZ8221113.1 IS3 family transposase [Acidovorax sp.]
MTRHTESVEVVVKDQRRRRWSLSEKAALVRRTFEPGMSVSLVARQEGVSAGLLFQWRKLERQGALTAVSAGEAVVPASELAAARAEIAKLQRVLGKKTLENEILKEAVEYAGRKKVDCALALVARGRPVKRVCRTMGLARSHLKDLLKRSADWTDGRSHRTPNDDAQLLDELRHEIAELPSYGYRRACALVNRQRRETGASPVNAKRVYRVLAGAGLLLPKAPRRRHSTRRHEGRVAVSRSDLRWCSDGLEIKCDSGQTVTATFTKDCCDREVLAWRAWEGKGLPGEPVREMLIEAVERRFGAVEAIPAGHELEFLSDNGGAYIAADTRALARSLGLKPINTPVCSPQSNGMAESFVNTFKRDYVARMDLSNARTVLAQLPAAFEHFNEVHPHSSLKMRSPREFRRQQAVVDDQALHCE